MLRKEEEPNLNELGVLHLEVSSREESNKVSKHAWEHEHC